ncbi:U-box domain-containing protein 33-like [Zingiber officinale]|uniref:U-box domain-containing protein 33-like n=1 Tax=Zingiber officinale TaxID=94328 RepID=UPI001C4C2397|nr:U-box domain-containing protein 33-like [Zingiber officinale]
MERRRSGHPSSRGSLREIVEEPRESPLPAEEEAVYVAVEKEFREWSDNFLWVLRNTSKEKKIVIVHVHRPAHRIPTELGWLPANQLKEKEVSAYRDDEREKMNQCLDEYVNLCSRVKVHKAETLVIEKDNVGKGLLELVANRGITKLVMGAAADRNYSRKMRAPKSKTALSLQQQADPSCKIWFVCKGNLICPRDACLDEPIIPKSLVESPNSVSNLPEVRRRTMSLSQVQGDLTNFSNLTTQDIFTPRSKSVNFTTYTELTLASLSNEGPARSPMSGGRECNNFDNWATILRGSDGSICDDDVQMIPKDVCRDDESIILPLMHDAEEDCPVQSPQHELQDLDVDDAVYKKLQAAISEVENSKREAYEEFYKRQKAEKDLAEAMRKVKVAETLYTREAKLRKEIEEALEKGKGELSSLKQQQDEVHEELRQVREKMEGIQYQKSESDQTLNDTKGKLSEAYAYIDSIRQEHEVLRQELDDAIGENEELSQKKGDVTISSYGAEAFSHFSLSELEQAADNFHLSSKIGEGGYGCVYKGFLRHTKVAIKRLHPEGMQGKSEFQREIEVLSKVRHPNLVTLIGACPEAWTLVYEFLPNGSLEDRLTCADNTPPLTWQARVRIASEICLALIFLHSCKPLGVVHGDLKPANILLDANLVSKLGDFGICRLLDQSINSTTLFHCTHQPKGTFAYMDPELLSYGEITTKSDIYSFGVILLRLLTGRPAFGISKVVQDALDKKSSHEIFDRSAGDWPYVQAKKLVKLGLKCCEMNRKNRPDTKEAWEILEPFAKYASFKRSSTSFRSITEDIPSYFICPIVKELMKDPQVAADGFTYEAKAIRGWLHSGRGTSPITNVELSHHELTPNHALRYAIQGWLQQFQK